MLPRVVPRSPGIRPDTPRGLLHFSRLHPVRARRPQGACSEPERRIEVVPADLVHLVRHGEVQNPDGVLYGRLPGYGLSERGHRMAEAAAASLAGRPLVALVASPLQRTRESAQPWSERYGLEIRIDDRLIEPTNRFEGTRVREEVRRPRNWPALLAPWRPSWGEPYASIVRRMRAALDDAADSVERGEVVLVSHQLPIWMVVRSVAGRPLPHSPLSRRCALSSVTTFRRERGVWREAGYSEPAAILLAGAVDEGAA